MKTTTRSCLHPAYRPLPPAHCSCGGARVGTGGRLLSAKTQVRFLPPQLAKVENLSRSRTSLHMEVIRPDEEPVLKTGGGFESLVGSSPTASARCVYFAVPWSSGDDSWPTPRQQGFDSLRDHLLTVPRYANWPSGLA